MNPNETLNKGHWFIFSSSTGQGLRLLVITYQNLWHMIWMTSKIQWLSNLNHESNKLVLKEEKQKQKNKIVDWKTKKWEIGQNLTWKKVPDWKINVQDLGKTINMYEVYDINLCNAIFFLHRNQNMCWYVYARSF